jgi:hypothetical protein
MSSFYQHQQQQHQHQQQQQQFNHASSQDVTPNAFPQFHNVSPEMINFGLNAGQDLLKKQKDKWMPGVSGFWDSLKFYFAVSICFV